MAIAETQVSDEHHDEHEHGEFIAHHFDNAEQQYDSGKLGIWVFLVTEVLFFSGLFVAYTLYRSHHPEIFVQAHVFLDKWLGGLNTVVLLFSSLTMALAVRNSQLGNNKQVSFFVLITMVCAAVFIGVKAIEYSHKWDQGILVRSAFNYSSAHPEPKTGIGQALHISDYLVYLSVVPTILLVGFLVAAGVFFVNGKKTLATFMACLAITTGGYFLGAVGSQIYMNVTDGGVGGHASQPLLLYAQESEAKHGSTGEATSGEVHDKTGGETHAADAEHSDHAHDASGHESDASHGPDPTKFSRDIGIFFSIYYCMTGLHAFHIIGGIIALAWILWRSLLGQWRFDYFGPVDFVGLYWHLVDLIWIFLFPLLYLID
jgi:cytochrome c oxidase subunit 3